MTGPSMKGGFRDSTGLAIGATPGAILVEGKAKCGYTHQAEPPEATVQGKGE